MKIRGRIRSMRSREHRSERRKGKPFGFAIDQQIARRLLVINGDRHNNSLSPLDRDPRILKVRILP